MYRTYSKTSSPQLQISVCRRLFTVPGSVMRNKDYISWQKVCQQKPIRLRTFKTVGDRMWLPVRPRHKNKGKEGTGPLKKRLLSQGMLLFPTLHNLLIVRMNAANKRRGIGKNKQTYGSLPCLPVCISIILRRIARKFTKKLEKICIFTGLTCVCVLNFLLNNDILRRNMDVYVRTKCAQILCIKVVAIL